MNKEKEKLHHRLLDANDAILITCEGAHVSVDVLGSLVEVGAGLSYALAQNTHLADFFLSVVGSTVAASIEIGDEKKAIEIKRALEGILLYLNETKSKTQN